MMNRLQTLSLWAMVVIPVLFLVAAMYFRSAGFFFYSLPGAVAPGITGYLISKAPKQTQ